MGGGGGVIEIVIAAALLIRRKSSNYELDFQNPGVFYPPAVPTWDDQGNFVMRRHFLSTDNERFFDIQNCMQPLVAFARRGWTRELLQLRMSISGHSEIRSTAA